MGSRVWGGWIVFVVFAALPFIEAAVDTPSVVSLAPPQPTVPAGPGAASTGLAPPGVPPDFAGSPLAFLSCAPPDSLILLPGIGPVLAARIVDARSGQRAFVSWDDLRNRVSGIGEKSVARLRKLADPTAR